MFVSSHRRELFNVLFWCCLLTSPGWCGEFVCILNECRIESHYKHCSIFMRVENVNKSYWKIQYIKLKNVFSLPK